MPSLKFPILKIDIRNVFPLHGFVCVCVCVSTLSASCGRSRFVTNPTSRRHGTLMAPETLCGAPIIFVFLETWNRLLNTSSPPVQKPVSLFLWNLLHFHKAQTKALLFERKLTTDMFSVLWSFYFRFKATVDDNKGNRDRFIKKREPLLRGDELAMPPNKLPVTLTSN